MIWPKRPVVGVQVGAWVATPWRSRRYRGQDAGLPHFRCRVSPRSRRRRNRIPVITKPDMWTPSLVFAEW